MDERTDKVFTALCNHCVNIMDGWVPYPAWAIAQSCGLTIHQTRSELNRLRGMGLCTVDTMALDKEDYILPYRGWQVTRKAKGTQQYKDAELEEAKLCAECFGGSVESYLLSESYPCSNYDNGMCVIDRKDCAGSYCPAWKERYEWQ